MLERIALAVLSLALCGWPSVNLGGGGGEAPCTVGPCLPILHRMDFEGTGCTDTIGSFTCTEVGTPDTDCNTGITCPIDEDLSARVATIGDKIYWLGLSARTTGWLTLDFKYEMEADGRFAFEERIGMYSSATNPDCVSKVFGAAGAMAVTANSGLQSGGTVPTGSQLTRYLRITYDIANDDCYLRASATNFGATDIGSISALGDSAGSITGWVISYKEVTDPEHVFDDIMLCDGDANAEASPLGICGGP